MSRSVDPREASPFVKERLAQSGLRILNPPPEVRSPAESPPAESPPAESPPAESPANAAGSSTTDVARVGPSVWVVFAGDAPVGYTPTQAKADENITSLALKLETSLRKPGRTETVVETTADGVRTVLARDLGYFSNWPYVRAQTYHRHQVFLL